MHITGLAHPPRATPHHTPEPERASVPVLSARAPRPPLSYDRVLTWALLGSALLHLLVLLLSPSFIRVGLPPGWTETQYEQVTGRNEIQLLNPVAVEGVVETTVPADTRPVEERRQPVPAFQSPTLQPRPGAETAPLTPPVEAARPGSERSVGERLQPGFRDPRLYVNPNDITHPRREATQHEQYMEHFQARIDAMNDSMYAAGQGPNTDWTVKDKDGKRWGLSEEGLHLGGLTVPRALIPLPGATGDNQQLEREREEQRQREEILRQEEDRKRREAQAESIRETRERKAAERKKTGGGGGGG